MRGLDRGRELGHHVLDELELRATIGTHLLIDGDGLTHTDAGFLLGIGLGQHRDALGVGLTDELHARGVGRSHDLDLVGVRLGDAR